MGKRFKTKKSKKNFLKYIVFIVVLYLIYSLGSFIFLNLKLVDNNEDFLKNLLIDSNHHILYEDMNKNILYKVSQIFTKINIKNPVSIIESSFNQKNDSDKEILVYNETFNINSSVKEVNNYMSNKNINKEPMVYIYNTHQTEKYSGENLDGVKPDVLMASHLLKDKLEKLNIPTIVEESDIIEFMNVNSWSYNNSYKASRYYLLDVLKNNPSIKLFIDLHRDSLDKKGSTVSINNKKYAKILFVVGKEHSDYQRNLDLANTINNKVKSKYPDLSRGVLEKEGSNVNGIYNQDVSNNCLLLELGGKENNLAEIINTIDVVAPIIKEYLNEKGK